MIERQVWRRGRSLGIDAACGDEALSKDTTPDLHLQLSRSSLIRVEAEEDVYKAIPVRPFQMSKFLSYNTTADCT